MISQRSPITQREFEERSGCGRKRDRRDEGLEGDAGEEKENGEAEDYASIIRNTGRTAKQVESKEENRRKQK